MQRWSPRWSAAAGRTTPALGLGRVGETRTSPRVRQRPSIEQREGDGDDQEQRFVERAWDRCQPQRSEPTQRSWDALVRRGDPDSADGAHDEGADPSHARESSAR